MLRQSLRRLVLPSGQPVDVPALLAAAHLDGTDRAEVLDVDAFLRLARLVEAEGSATPR